MSVQMKNEKPWKAVVSVSEHCRLLQMSRSQFYSHIKKGTFHEPLRLESNGRPYFTASMLEDNLQARESGVGVNGEYVLFYERQTTETKPSSKKPKSNHSALIDGLVALGIGSVTSGQVESALEVCFPNGTTGHDDTAVLRAVFRHLKRSRVG